MDNPYAAPKPAVGSAPGNGATYMPSICEMQGRIGRIRYAVYMAIVSVLTLLVTVAVYVVSTADDSLLFSSIMLVSIGAAAVIVRRRLQDLDKPDWWVALLLVPVVSIVLYLYLLLAPGQAGANRHGPAAAPNSRKLMLSAYALIAFYVLLIGGVLLASMQAAARMEAAPEQAPPAGMAAQQDPDE